MVCTFLGLPSFASSWDDSMCVCTTGRWDLLKASTVSDLSERAASCTRVGEENSIEVAHIATIVDRIVFSLVCSTPSYSIELVIELSCLLFYISTFLISACIIVLPQHISRMSAFSNCPCRLAIRPSLPGIVEPNMYWCLRLCLACSSACLTDHSCPEVCAACITCLSSAV